MFKEPIKVPLFDKEPTTEEDVTTEESTEEEKEITVDPNTKYVQRDSDEEMLISTKEEWEIVRNSVGNESYEEILKNNPDVPEKDYKQIEWDQVDKVFPNWYVVGASVANWKFGWKRYGDRPGVIGIKTNVEHNLLELSRMLKYVDRHIDECTNEEVKKEFLEKKYPKIVKARQVSMNMYKKYDRERCVQFLREHPIVGKYGKRVIETKPKKN